MNNNGLLKKSLIILACIGVVGGVTYYVTHRPAITVVTDQGSFTVSDYEENRDKDEILSIFVSDRYWLLSSDDYDPEFMLAYKAPDTNPLYLGALQVKVMHENGKFVGFTC